MSRARKIMSLALLLLAWLQPAFALPGAQDNFWSWLAPQLHLSQLEHPDIDAWEARYRRRQLELQVILERGADLLYPLALAVRDRGMPMEIALLPIIESQLDADATSASGARGLWQLLPSTARHLGLQQDWWQDQSRDFNRSTAAALDYLDYLHKRFGSWSLTLAAYNTGESRLARILRRRVQDGLDDDYWALDLHSETRAYVPKLLGLARVLRNPGQLVLPKVQTRRRFARYATDGPLDVMQIAALANVSVEQIYRLNPHLLRWALPPDGPFEVNLPVDSGQDFRRALHELPDGERRRWKRHSVSAGDSLGMIAQTHGSDSDTIRRLNRLRNDLIRPGQKLLLFQGDAKLPRLTLNAARQLGRVSYASRPLAGGVHEVRSGESLWTIAQQYGASVEQIKAQNARLTDHQLIPGQMLKIGSADRRQRLFYEVRPGDVLSLIAQRYQVSVGDIRRWNQLHSTTIRPGQILELRVAPDRG